MDINCKPILKKDQMEKYERYAKLKAKKLQLKRMKVKQVIFKFKVWARFGAAFDLNPYILYTNISGVYISKILKMKNEYSSPDLFCIQMQ